MLQRVADALATMNANLEKFDRPLTVVEFAALISYHAESVRRAIREGRINALRFGNSFRIPPAEVSKILSQGLPPSK